jgi:predicted secreted hydrolase
MAAHECAQTEWWYYTGHLVAENGDRYGFEFTIFRRRVDDDKALGVPLRWFGRTGHMLNFALTDEKTGRFVCEGRSSFSGKDAYTLEDRYSVALQDYKAWGDENSQHIEASTKKNVALKMDLEPLKKAVLHGKGGIVAKGTDMANCYMSFTRLGVSGTLSLGSRDLKVTGQAWFDHEYGYMGATPVSGWDWFSLQLDDHTEYMLYCIRIPGGKIAPESRACRIDEKGEEQTVPFSEMDINPLGKWESPHTHGMYPSGWRITYAPWGLDLVVVPTVADQEFRYHDVSYWEGSCTVIGRPADGQAYVELVGYSEWGPFAKMLGESAKKKK